MASLYSILYISIIPSRFRSFNSTYVKASLGHHELIDLSETRGSQGYQSFANQQTLGRGAFQAPPSSFFPCH